MYQDDDDIMPEFKKVLSRVKNVGGFKNINETFTKRNIKEVTRGGEERLQQFLVGEVGPDFIFKSLQFHCRATWNDVANLAQMIDRKIQVYIGQFATFKTNWATTIMTEKQLHPTSKERGNQIYKTLRLCKFVNSVANMITSYALIMENQQEFLHYTTVPIQFKEIANEYLLNYTINIHFGTRELTKPWYQNVSVSVHIPRGIYDTKISLMQTIPRGMPDQEEIAHSQFYHQPLKFPKEEVKEWRLDIHDWFCYPGYGFLLMIPFYRQWNVDSFSLLTDNCFNVPLYCKRISSNVNCMWFSLCTDEKTTVKDMVDLRAFPEKIESLLDLTRITGACLIMSNSKQQVLSFPDDDEHPSCLMWHHFNIYRHSSGIAGNFVCSE